MLNKASESAQGTSRKTAISNEKRSSRSARGPREPEYYDTLPVDVLTEEIGRWLRNCRARAHTTKSQEMEQLIGSKLIWFLEHHGFEECGQDELEAFIIYARESHNHPLGRWNANLPHSKKALSRASLRSYFNYLKIIFAWLKKQGVIEESPMVRLDPPEYRESARTTYTNDQVKLLLKACSQTRYARRDTALFLLMLDIGPRAGEICNITLGDLNLEENSVWLFGKGEKGREANFGIATANAIDLYLQEGNRNPERMPGHALFQSENSPLPNGGMTPSGVGQLFKRLKKYAKLHGVRVHPHKMRATCITDLLNDNMPLKMVQQLAGHQDGRQTNKYYGTTSEVARAMQRKHSRADNLLQPKRQSRHYRN